MNFPDMIAEYEAELVHRACQAEGFDAALTELDFCPFRTALVSGSHQQIGPPCG
jgi:hypothetical protein